MDREKLNEYGQTALLMLGEIKSGTFPNTCVIEGRDTEARKKTALLMAASLFCSCPDVAERPCTECSECQKALACHHPDLRLLSPFADKITVDDVRSVRSDAFATPFEAECKVYIFEEAQELNVQSQNALLKILEEPPKNVYFMLLAPSSKALLPTVRSRCASFGLGEMSQSELMKSVSALMPGESGETRERVCAALLFLEGTELSAENVQRIKKALDVCDGFFASGSFDYSVFPKKREDDGILRTVLRLAAVCASRLSQEKKGVRTDARQKLLSDSAANAALQRLTLRRTLELYELFSRICDMLLANANLNVLAAYMRSEL